ncbi:MAG: hypothetical protein AABY22_10135, partial [Nanoarchaeota archaeon]
MGLDGLLIFRLIIIIYGIILSIPFIIYSIKIALILVEYTSKKLRKIQTIEIKGNLLSFVEKYKAWGFSYHFTIVYFGLITLLKIIGIGLPSTLVFIPFYIVSLAFIKLAGSILEKEIDQISEFKFFWYIVLFAIVLCGYIIAFSLLYIPSISIGYGQFEDKAGNLKPLGTTESIYYSGFTFFSMEYEEAISKGSLTLITLIETVVLDFVILKS